MTSRSSSSAPLLFLVVLSSKPQQLAADPQELVESHRDTVRRPSDLVTTRLLLAPTARPLAKGTGYVSDHYLFFPGVAYGITGNVSVLAGMSLVPALGLADQLKYVTSRLAVRWSEHVSTAAGMLAVSADIDAEEAAARIAFAIATLGGPDLSLTVGGGHGWVRDAEGQVGWAQDPILGLGGTWRFSRRLAVVTEMWLFDGLDIDWREQPSPIALRTFADEWSADWGFVLLGESLEERIPIPWLSITWHFGRHDDERSEGLLR